MKNHVVVIGGGFAGGAAASALAEAGAHVTLLERRQVLGGRASSLRDGVTRDDVDNGQHLFLGAYRDTRRFLRRLKVEDRLRFMGRLSVPFLSPAGASALDCPNLPFSLGVLTGLLGFGALRARDKFSLLKGLTSAHFFRPKDLAAITVSQWLDRLKQSSGARRAFWTPLCLATLNARPETACAAALEVVLREGLFAGREERALGYATVSLGKLWPVDLPGYLKSRGGVLSTEQTVTGFDMADGRVTGVRLEGGGEGEAEAVVCAASLPAFLELCPESLRPHYAALREATYSPILSVNLWFDKPVLDRPFAGILDADVQWIFNRAALWGGSGVNPGYVSLVVSDAKAFAEAPSEDIIALALKDLRGVLPGVGTPLHATVVWERQATPAPTPAFWRARPPTITPVENLFLAGDWVDAGLPPTIEAACRSGHRAAEAAMRYLDQKHGAGAPAAAA